MNSNDEIRIESDPALPRDIKKAVDGNGSFYGLVHKNRMEGEFCQRRRVTLGKVDFPALMDYLASLYAETMFKPDYLFLSPDDYEALQYNDPYIARMRRYSAVDTPNINRRGYVVKIASPANGKSIYLATLPDLQEGEIMVMYPYE